MFERTRFGRPLILAAILGCTLSVFTPWLRGSTFGFIRTAYGIDLLPGYVTLVLMAIALLNEWRASPGRRTNLLLTIVFALSSLGVFFTLVLFLQYGSVQWGLVVSALFHLAGITLPFPGSRHLRELAEKDRELQRETLGKEDKS